MKLRVAAAIGPIAIVFFVIALLLRPSSRPLAVAPGVVEAEPARSAATPVPLARRRGEDPTAAVERAAPADGSVAGVVFAEETDEPIGWACVRCEFRRPDGAADESFTIADERGAYRLDGVLGSVEQFEIRHGSLGEPVVVSAGGLEVGSGRTVARDLRVGVHPEVGGSVVDLASGAPIANARVEAVASSSRAALSDEAGQFRLRRLVPHDGADGLRFVVTHPDYMDLETLVDPRAPTSGDVRFALRRCSRLSGTVLDARGAPAAARLELGYLGRILAVADAGEDGAFAFRSVPPVRGASLVARVHGGEGSPRGAVSLLDLDLRGDCTGLVLRADDPCTASLETEGGRRRGDPPRVRRVDAPGRQWIAGRDLEAGTYLVDSADPPLVVVTIRAGELRREVVTPTVESSPAWLSGKVVDEDDVPVTQFAIATETPSRRLGESDCPWLATLPGTFELEAVGGWPLRVTVRDERGRVGVAELEIPPFEHAQLLRIVVR